MNSLDKLKIILSNNGRSLTAARIEIFNTLNNLNYPLPVSRLADKIENIDRASVYRNIELFEKIGIVNRAWIGFKSTVELSDEFSEHHHHITCINCAKTQRFENLKIESILKQIAHSNGFDSKSHVVEISGYCSNCSPGAK